MYFLFSFIPESEKGIRFAEKKKPSSKIPKKGKKNHLDSLLLSNQVNKYKKFYHYHYQCWGASTFFYKFLLPAPNFF